MNTSTQAAIDNAAASCSTRQPRDLAMQALLLRSARDSAKWHYTADAILEARASWLTWLTVGQRKWQRETRRPSRARHHDSIEIRERYVRCH